MTGVHIANQNGTVTSYFKDFHGNIAGKTTKTGEMFNEMGIKMDYDAFGNQWIGDVPDPFGYCGEYLDSESNLIYLRNRYYNSTIGRFITEDPVKDGLNWYAYAGNNPVMFFDPSGLYTAGNTVMGVTKLISNIEEKDTGYYGSLRDISDYTMKDYELIWQEDGDGAKVTYTVDEHYTMEIYFDSRDEGTYASKIEYYYSANDRTVNITNATTNPKRDLINEQDAQFYLKKDENSDNIVVMSKISTTLYLNKSGAKEKYLFGVIELARRDTGSDMHTFQYNLNKWSYADLLEMDLSAIGDAYEAYHNNWSAWDDYADWLKYTFN